MAYLDKKISALPPLAPEAVDRIYEAYKDQIQVIPTVVFFDPAGKEVFRHQGFMSEEKVKEQLAKMRVV